MQVIDRQQSDALMLEARQSPRRRAHLLLHDGHADQVQRLFVAFVQGTYIQPHCHPEQWEMIVPLRGVLDVLIFSADGRVQKREKIAPGSTDVVTVPAGVWHTLIAGSETALMLEAKPGPFRPAVFAQWAPDEANVGDYLAKLTRD